MEIELVKVKEETGPIIPSVCPFCQEDLPTLTGPKGQLPQCQGCKSFVLEPRSWLLGTPEVLALPAERPYSCSFCPKRFKRASDRRDHERVHTGERPYGCGICGKRFTQSSVLSGHMRIHTGERPFCCGVCFKSFNNGSNFRKHQRIHGQLFGYNNKGDDEKDRDLLLGKKQSQLVEGQNGCQMVKEVRHSENKRKQDPKGRQDSHCNNRISPNSSCGSGLRQPNDSVGHFKGIGLKQDDSSHQMRQNNYECIGFKSLSQTGDGKRHVSCLGENGNCSPGSRVTENGHSFQPLRGVSSENHTKVMRQNKAGGSHTQEEQKQPAESYNDKLQLHGSSWGNGLLLVDGDKQGQESQIRGYLVRRPNGGYLKGLKHSSGEGISANLRQNGTQESHLSGPNPNREVSILELRQNGNCGDAANGRKPKKPGQFGELTQGGGTNKEKWMDFQVGSPGKINADTPKVSSWTCPTGSNVLAWEEPNIRIMKEKDEFEECSALDIPITTSPWQPDSPEPYSLPCNISISPSNHSHHQFRSTFQHWEEDGSAPSFPFQDPETYDQHSMSALDSKPCMCFACPKQFRRATDLKEHLRVHTGERPFGCSVCGKRFTQSSALVTHRRLHTGEKPFECAVCSRRFNNSSNFAKHRRLHGQEGTRHSNKAIVKDLWSTKPH
ncbi:oocyte zinc finger protein XlCOF7.1-like [Sceloporus undulatus]|uniref:oocyte zinc finger protein XlCOF7.1-like n=1 Tax=Sceloporus undulatus TaxID=8520 RepID=UPI001C4B1073|nr:oocyte zinc finger protein XlCOF7.1-like [Sceloporus undulatus]